MIRTGLVAIGAVTLVWNSLILRTALADNSGCTSIEARCAVEAGGKCDGKTGHWCWGISREGEHCGGSGRAFLACMARHGVSAPVANVDRPGTPATAANPGKCTSVQARCIMEAGGYCDPRTGHWRLGYVFQHYYGGNNMAFMACLDRARSTQK
jgi:hypothetical protein